MDIMWTRRKDNINGFIKIHVGNLMKMFDIDFKESNY